MELSYAPQKHVNEVLGNLGFSCPKCKFNSRLSGDEPD